MKIILSRKGFDSSREYGRVPSPIFPDDSMLSLPIPGRRMGIAYNELQFGGMSVGRIVEQLTHSRTTGRARIRGSKLAHLDPDLRASAGLDRSANWRPLFGQAGLAQAHLDENGVGEGDLFLFFGLYRRVINDGGWWRFDADAPKLHVLWGWLQVARVLTGGHTNRSKAPSWARYFDHFHVTGEDFQVRRYNAVYVARKKLRIPGLDHTLPGAAVFPRFNSALTLTKPGQPYCSVWKLPMCLAPRKGQALMTYHPRERWRVRNGHCEVQSVGKGQEFVIDAERCKPVISWIRDLIASNCKQ